MLQDRKGTSQTIEKGIQLYKINPAVRPKYFDMLFQALKTIRPTSVEAERAFFAMGFFLFEKLEIEWMTKP